MVVKPQSGSGARTTVISTSGQQDIREHVVSLFGNKVAAALQPIDEELAPDIRVCGYVTQLGHLQNLSFFITAVVVAVTYTCFRLHSSSPTSGAYSRINMLPFADMRWGLRRLLSGAGTAGSGRSTNDRQFFFMNGRPVEMPKVVRIMNEAYKSLSSFTASTAKPMAVLNWLVPTARCAAVLHLLSLAA